MRLYATSAASLLAVLLCLLVPFSTVRAASPRLHQVTATTPLAAVRATVIGDYNPRFNEYTCSTQLPMHRIAAWTTCPFTARLRQRLSQSGHVNRGVELCGYQYPPRTVLLHALTSTTIVARVNAHWDFGAHNSYTSTFLVIRRGGTWLVDNEYLIGKPSKDLYHEGMRSFCP